MPGNISPKGAGPSEGWYEELFKMLLESSPSSVLLVDRSLRVSATNRNFLDKTRRSEDSTIGELLIKVFPSPILDVTRMERRVEEVFKDGGASPGEQLTYRAPGVPTRTYYYRVVPIKAQGSIEYAMILMDDITDKVLLIQQAHLVQARLASVVQYASDLVLSADREGQIVTWNPAAERITGLSLYDMRGRPVADLCSGADRDAVNAIIRQLNHGKPEGSAELSIEPRPGVVIPMSWAFSRMCDDSDKMIGLVALGRDLTERRSFEAHLAQSEKLAALGVMAGGIAHELRNPLAVSYSATQFLQEDNLEPEFRAECLSKILDGIQRASSIVENLLSFARPSSDAHVKIANLVTVVRDTTKLLANQAGLQKIAVTESYPNHPVHVRGNTSTLQQIATNLILNAYAAMAEGGVLGIGVRLQNREAVLSVSDTGSGIPEADLSKLFDPFFTTKPPREGTGLGLSICHTFVRQIGGRITVASKVGKGSTFTVFLPVVPGP